MEVATRKALRDSIQAWEMNLLRAQVGRVESIHVGSEYCPLCKLFNREDIPHEDRCVGCPVSERTGGTYCTGTPFIPFARALYVQKKIGRATDELVRLIEDEVEFLKSLESDQ